MQPDAHAALTDALATRLADDDRVLGLVLLGSTAEGADAFSDHDLWVVTVPGRQEEMRVDLGWLPSDVDPVLVVRETAHGVKVLGRDGHLLEIAVFDLDELAVTRPTRMRIAFDRGGVAQRLEEIAGRDGPTAPPDPAHHLGQLVTCALVGALRARRGERLSGAHLVLGEAVRHLVVLVAATVPNPDVGVLDPLDPFRRFDTVYPAIAADVAHALREPVEDAALGLLAVADAAVRPLRPDLPWAGLEAARERLLRG